MKYQVPGPRGDSLAFKGPNIPYEVYRVPATTVTTTLAVA